VIGTDNISISIIGLEDIINKYLTTKRITSLKGTIILFLVMHVGVMV
jgi:hypothetical protein